MLFRSIFIVYGMLTDEKFCDAAMKFMLLKDTEGHYYTLDEYKTLVEASQTDAEGRIIYLYATDATAQYDYIKAANDKGYNVLLLDGQLDNHFVGLLERKLENTGLVRVDSDVTDNLIRKNDRKVAELTPAARAIMTRLFELPTRKVEKTSFMVQFEALAPSSQPVVLTQNEYMRRMKEMAAMQPGMNFYGELPDSYTVVVNTEHPLVKTIISKAEGALDSTVEPLLKTIDEANAKAEETRKAAGNEELSAEARAIVDEAEKTVTDSRKTMDEAIDAYAPGNPEISQLVDLALLGNGLLRGEALSTFINRSVELMK